MLIILTLISIAVFFVSDKYKFLFTISILSFGVVFACAEAVEALVSDSGIIEYASGSSALFGFDYPFMDSLSAIFVIITSIATFSVTMYAKDYIGAYVGQKSSAQISLHYLSLLLLYFSMIFVVSFRGGFAFLFSWELMTISSFLLILFDGEKREVRRAAINYLVLMHIGFVFILVGFVVSSGDGSILGFDALSTYFRNNNPLPLFILFFIGFGMKAGLFPLHVWLPEAHPAAPSHVSALMSGVMIKMGAYGVIRVLTYINTELYIIGLIILVVGAITALWGVILASLQNDLKKLLAYSSIENIGIIFTGLGVGIIGRATGNNMLAILGLSGALLHIVNHSFFKPMLFMNAGSVYLTTHTRNIDELGGLSKRMPITSWLFLVASLAICALPPFNGFISEFIIYLGLFDSVSQAGEVLLSVVVIATLALVGGISILVFTKAFGISFLGRARCCKAESAREVTPMMLSAQALPLAGIILIGIFPMFFVSIVGAIVCSTFKLPMIVAFDTYVSGVMMNISLIMISLIAVVTIIYFLKIFVQRRRVVSESPTWGCGFTATNKFMQYTGESYSDGLSRITKSLTNDSGTKGEIDKDEIFATSRDFGIKHRDKIDKRLSGLWSFVIRKFNTRLSLFQTGKINHYILHALLFLAFIFLLTIIGLI